MGWPGPVTHRQLKAWKEWQDAVWDVPSLTDHYVMANSCEVRRVLSKNPNSIKPDEFRLAFKRGKVEARKTKESVAQVSQSIWLSRMSMPVQQVGFHTTTSLQGSPEE